MVFVSVSVMCVQVCCRTHITDTCMSDFRSARTLITGSLFAALAAIPFVHTSATAQSVPIVFRNVRVFDGTRGILDEDVLIENGRIVNVGRSLAAPRGAESIDGRGKTLLPGLIDSH